MTMAGLFWRLGWRVVRQRTPLCVAGALLLRRASRVMHEAGHRGLILAAQWDEKE